MNNLPFKIEVAGYCEGCPYFWEELNSIDVTQLDDKEQRMLHVIHCHNRDACARVARILNSLSGDTNGKTD